MPDDFRPPTEIRIGQYVLRPLTEAYVDIDLAAVNSSIDLIRETRGGTWPNEAVSREEDYADLVEHRKQFERRVAFAYSVLTLDEAECLGCVYIYPPNHPFDSSDKSAMPEGADAVISFWVSQSAYDAGFYPVLQHFVDGWVHQEWPFRKPFIANKLQA